MYKISPFTFVWVSECFIIHAYILAVWVCHVLTWKCLWLCVCAIIEKEGGRDNLLAAVGVPLSTHGLCVSFNPQRQLTNPINNLFRERIPIWFIQFAPNFKVNLLLVPLRSLTFPNKNASKQVTYTCSRDVTITINKNNVQDCTNFCYAWHDRSI